MAEEHKFLDEQGMIDLARKTMEELRSEGISLTELRRLENVLKGGGVGEVLIISGLLKTIAREVSPEASQRKLLRTHQLLTDLCHSMVELSRNLFDIEVWQHFNESGHETFGTYCEEILGVPVAKIERLKLVKDKPLRRAKEAGPAELFAWFFNAVEMLCGADMRGKQK